MPQCGCTICPWCRSDRCAFGVGVGGAVGVAVAVVAGVAVGVGGAVGVVVVVVVGVAVGVVVAVVVAVGVGFVVAVVVVVAVAAGVGVVVVVGVLRMSNRPNIPLPETAAGAVLVRAAQRSICHRCARVLRPGTRCYMAGQRPAATFLCVPCRLAQEPATDAPKEI
jgi:hypothetical protein